MTFLWTDEDGNFYVTMTNNSKHIEEFRKQFETNAVTIGDKLVLVKCEIYGGSLFTKLRTQVEEADMVDEITANVIDIGVK